MPVEPAEDALLGVLFQGHILSSPRLALATLVLWAGDKETLSFHLWVWTFCEVWYGGRPTVCVCVHVGARCGVGARIAPPLMEATDASRLVCVVVVSYQEYSLTRHTSLRGARGRRAARRRRGPRQGRARVSRHALALKLQWRSPVEADSSRCAGRVQCLPGAPGGASRAGRGVGAPRRGSAARRPKARRRPHVEQRRPPPQLWLGRARPRRWRPGVLQVGSSRVCRALCVFGALLRRDVGMEGKSEGSHRGAEPITASSVRRCCTLAA